MGLDSKMSDLPVEHIRPDGLPESAMHQ
jgi:hypothetical protein